MASKKVSETVFEIANPIALSHGCFVDDVEFKKEGADFVLRVIIDVEDDSNGGVSIDQCELVSRALSDILDEQDPIDKAYMLEVSSPGIDRELKKEKDFIRFMGREVDVKLYKAIEGSKILSGKLISRTSEEIIIEADGKEIKIPASDAASVRLAVIW
ncbi:MAG: ribosome maturation factor RimP [Ruminococcaceae bacterium]|nr:ribosome maturation factor RimP [Oscillospiraceae bacterium]